MTTSPVVSTFMARLRTSRPSCRRESANDDLFLFRVASLTLFPSSLIMIDTNVGKGSHSVECQLLGEEGKTTAPFKILGIFTT